MSRSGRVALLAAAAGAAVLLVIGLRLRIGAPEPGQPRQGRPSEAVRVTPPASGSLAPKRTTAAPEPQVPIDLPTPPPGLDRELARTYQRALTGQGFRIGALTISDRRATGGVRRAEIIYRAAAGGTVASLRPDLVRILSPGANPKLALDQITVRATGPGGAVIATVTVAVTDLDRWLKAQITDDQFFATWNLSAR